MIDLDAHHRACIIALTILISTSCSQDEEAYAYSGDGGAQVPQIPEPTVWLRWSEASTWPRGRKPEAGSDVTIPRGVGILVDESPPPIDVLDVRGSLMFEDERDVELSADVIMVHGGRLRVGTASAPFRHRATITLTDTDRGGDVHGMGTRGILVMEGILELHSADDQATFTKLASSTSAGATTLTLLDATGFHEGDRIAVAPTDFRSAGNTEVVDVASVSGQTVSLASPLARARWGTTQTYAGRVVDERAEVANLTRNVVVQGADDAAFADHGFGAHVMVMRSSLATIHGVTFRRMGQRGETARYPIHFHRMSYDDRGRFIGDADQNRVERSVISDSENRCIVVHATNGVTVTDNVCHDIVGHAVFLEDAVEMRNRIERNLVLGVRNPASADRLLVHEGAIIQGGSSGFWLTHGDNVVRDNVAVDCEGNGFWYSIPEEPLRTSANVAMRPAYMPFGTFEDNVAHSNGGLGLNFDWVSIDDDGNVAPFKYQPFSSGRPGNDAERLDVVLARFVAYKNADSAIWNRAERIRMRDFVLADHPGTMFSGSSTNCTIEGALIVGTTDNDATAGPADRPPNGAASYHSSCDILRNTFVNLPIVVGRSSGAFRTDDYYIRAVDRGLARNVENVFIDTHAGYRTPMPAPAENFARSGALWDPAGLWGAAGNYWVYDLPFLTSGSTCTDVAPAGQNGRSCAGPYYGIGRFYLDDSGDVFQPLVPIEVTREDAGNAVFAIGDGNDADALGWMRHFAVIRGGRYVLRFPGRSAPRSIEVSVDNLQSASDYALLALPFDGDRTPKVYGTTWPNPEEADGFAASDSRNGFVRRLSSAASVDAVANSDGTLFFRDAANDRVWIRIQGGLPFVGTPPQFSDEDLYRPMIYRIEPAN